MIHEWTVRTTRRGLVDITEDVAAAAAAAGRGVDEGLCTVFLPHTSCSLLIQENADPTARRDLEAFLDRIAPDGDPRYTHDSEGPDDMPSHIRAMLLPASLHVPMRQGRLLLGRWQGIYLCEHRLRGAARRVIVQVLA